MKVSDFDHKKIEEKPGYDHKAIEAYWRRMWEKLGIYEPDLLSAKDPFFNLMMFPYPSAEGLHVGNVYAFCGSDVFGRFMRMQGKDVFEPIGLDGFGIHSENFALRIGEHPMKLAKRTEANFYRQLAMIGNGFAWGSKLETYDSNYYKWTQWIFIQLFKAGLAYRGKAEVNWCPTCLTVLSDEQVVAKQLTINNKQLTKSVCERCETEVVRRELTQWFFRITAYAQKLLDGLDKIDWSERVKVAQRNWIGKSEGVTIKFTVDPSFVRAGSSQFTDKTKKQKTENRELRTENYIEVFTTRPDTIYGVTFVVLAPQHPLVTEIIDRTKGLLKQEIQAYVEGSIKKHNAERKSINIKGDEGGEKAQKSGVFTGFHAINPLNGKEVPIYISDYVLTSYGTGAVMGVPGHDQRDWDFAKEYHLDIVEVIAGGDVSRVAFTKEGVLVNCGKFSGMNSKAAINVITKYIEDEQYGSKDNMWHLRDWTISRQRYWGVPIPMIYCEKCAKEGKSWFTEEGKEGQEGQEGREAYSWESAGWFPVADADLPVELPYIENFKPTRTEVSPLAADESFIKVKCPGCGSWARRETDVSDTFLDSSWYFLRYPSQSQKLKVKSEKLPWDSEITQRWLPVNMYIGGAEHAVLHLLYSRFLWKVFYDLGYFDFSAKGRLASGWDEPFTKFRAHGLLIKDGAKMSKSKGNVVNPDLYIEKYGSDTFRTYLMFCGRFEQGGDFRDSGIGGMSKFLKRIWRLVMENSEYSENSESQKIRKSEKSDNLKVRESVGEVNQRVGSGNPKFRQSDLSESSEFSEHLMHKTIKKVTADIESLNYNTAIAAIMEWVNSLEERVVQSAKFKVQSGETAVLITKEEVETLLLLLAPFAPFMCEELWQRLQTTDYGLRTTANSLRSSAVVSSQNAVDQLSDSRQWTKSIHTQPWPKFDPKLALATDTVLVVQVNGKVRDQIPTSLGLSEEDAKKLALTSKRVSKYIGGVEIKKVIYVRDKIISFVV